MKRSVFIEKTSKYISIQSYLIGRLRIPNIESEILYLECDVTMNALGQAIRNKLYESKEIPEIEFMRLFSDMSKLDQFHRSEKIKIIKKYGYKNSREINKDALFLNVSINNNIIYITPYHQDGLGTFTTAKDKNGKGIEFEYPISLSHVELGSVVINGFEYCTSIYK